jgi:hypothetical protein
MVKPIDPQRNAVDGIVSSTRISDVYIALSGVRPRKTGADTYRAPAAWRNGDGLNVALDDSRGVWHDFVTDDGGGVLDLVAQFRGGSRQDALKWLAEFAGMPLSDTPLSPADRARYAEERRQLEADIPDAQLFRRGAARLCDEALAVAKARYFAPTETAPDFAECVAMRDLTAQLARLQAMTDSAAVTEYRWWREHYPGMTWGVVRAQKALDAAQFRALKAYLRLSNPRERSAA